LPTAGARVLDVGANIGNHAIFFDRVCHADVVVFEPNPPVAQELIANLRRNRCWRTDTRHLGVALGASSASGHLHLSQRDLDQNNRGGTCVQISAGGTVPVQRLDALVTGNADLIKIDVEGMALEVLAGAAELLQAEPRPMLFVEVEGQNEGRLRHWLDTNNYVVRATFSMYADIVNYFCLPIGWRRTGHSMTSSGLRLMARYCALRLWSAGG